MVGKTQKAISSSEGLGIEEATPAGVLKLNGSLGNVAPHGCGDPRRVFWKACEHRKGKEMVDLGGVICREY